MADDLAPPSITPVTAVDAVSTAVADAVRAVFQPDARHGIDPTTAANVAESAAAISSTAAWKALISFIEKLSASTSSQLDNPSASAPVNSTAAATISSASAAASSSGLHTTSAGLQPQHDAIPQGSGAPPPHGHGSLSIVAPSPTAPQADHFYNVDLDDKATANLHAQAISVLNIKSLVPVTLDVNSGTYTRWRGLLLVILSKYALADHVLTDNYRPNRPDWMRMDCVVLSWMYGTISTDLLESVMTHTTTARLVWRSLEHQFLGNREARALDLNAEFYNFQQGDLSVTDYCRHLKAMAADLADVGEPVGDRTLTLATIQGFHENFAHLQSAFTMRKPFPSFAEVRSQLLLDELTKNRSRTPATALIAATGGRTSGGAANSNPAHITGYGNNSNTGNHNSNGRQGGNNRARHHNNNGGNGGQQQPQFRPPGSSAQVASWPSPLNPWNGTLQMWPVPVGMIPSRVVGSGSGLVGPRPGAPSHFAGSMVAASPNGVPQHPAAPSVLGHAGQAQSLAASTSYQPVFAATPSTPGTPASWNGSANTQWDQQGLINAFNTVSLSQPPSSDWYIDSGASSHMTSDAGTLSFSSQPNPNTPSHIIVGDGSPLPITATGSTHLSFPHRSFVLNNVLVSPEIIKNLIVVRRFARDNDVSVEFDKDGLDVKDFHSRNMIVWCNSFGDLYLVRPTELHYALAARESSVLWHHRLGHLGSEALTRLARSSVIPPYRELSVCHACQLGRHCRLPFNTSFTRATSNFDLIHCDLWTSPVSSVSGYKYYLVILDDCSHFVWTFPLRLKSDTFRTLTNFFAYVKTQFSKTIKSIQCDNGGKFDNTAARTFFLTEGVVLRMSCPHTSPQNGKAERMIRSINNIVRSLLFQASLPSSFWVEALHTATHLINRHPTKTLQFHTPFFALYGIHPTYNHLRVFGCKCYPNLSATAPDKLSLCFTACVFLGYPRDHKGYRCLDLSSN
ncbi:hypothetical protein OsI_25984 [Oryza sativa Indica Group]|uniref:Integrase catalytic domain-containing protein n=1 Tax=Oryza sativa subsp. indica TaxID=39946 RepID=B8B604_ORYSI|nr:hypothetical protein OsI_25984 [Oryza sativa Indica Group]